MNKTGKGGPKKGEVRNPNGRPIDVARKRFNAIVDKKGLLDKAIKVLEEELAKGGKGRITAASILIEQRMGKAAQTHDVQGSVDINWSGLANKCRK